jgi:hypothetical protein
VETLKKRVAELESELNRAFVQIETLSSLLDRAAFLEETSPLMKTQTQENRSSSVLSSLVEKIDDITRKGELSRSIDAPPKNPNYRVGVPGKVKGRYKNLKQQFLQSLSMVKELLVSNQALRDEINSGEENNSLLKREISSLIVRLE